MKRIMLIICFVLSLSLLVGCQSEKVKVKEDMKGEENTMEEFNSNINLTINGKVMKATLEDNETARELVKRLPLNIVMNELNENEKYYYFDKSLPSNSSKVGSINSGDIMLYGNDCLVLFYDSFSTSYSYTRIGKIDNPSDLKDIVGKGNIEIYISK